MSDKWPVVSPTNENISSSTNKNESDIEPTIRLIQHQEPIEIYQLLPKNENRYTANDNWWKHTLNKHFLLMILVNGLNANKMSNISCKKHGLYR